MRLLAALGHEDRLVIVERLLDEPATQAKLLEDLEIDSGTASKRLAILEDAHVVARERSHGPYRVVRPAETLEVLAAAAGLAVAISAELLQVDQGKLNEVRERQARHRKG